MNKDKILSRLKGIIPFVPTPFVTSEYPFTRLNEEGLITNLDYLAKYPFDCIAPTAGTGDLMTLTDEEYKAILNITMERVGEKFLIMPGLFQETERAIRMARYAQSIGYECVLSFPPPTLNLSQEGLCAHWRAIAEAVGGLAVIIFRAPWLPFSTEVLKELKDVPNIIAVKEETGDVLWFRKAKREYGGRYAFIGGGELQFLTYLMSGAEAITTGLPNFMPELFFRLYDLAKENQYVQAMELHDTLLPLLTLRQKQGNPIPLLKYAMELAGLAGGPNRLPQVGLSEEDKELTRKYLKELSIIK